MLPDTNETSYAMHSEALVACLACDGLLLGSFACLYRRCSITAVPQRHASMAAFTSSKPLILYQYHME
jgi:hypothetical protein